MQRPLRVFHLIKSLGRGGAEVLLADGPSHSDPTRFEFGFGYFLPHKDALVPALREAFGHVVCFEAASPGAMMASVGRVARHLRKWQADVLHCHLPLAGVVGRLAGAIVGVPVVYTEHNVLERYHRATRTASRLTWKLQRQVIAVSGEVEASIHRHVGHRVPVRVIRNGVSLANFDRKNHDTARARERLGIDPSHKVVGTVAVFRKQKRLDLWLHAASELARTHADVRFLLVGDGPLLGEVKQRIAELGLSDRVVLPGLQPDVKPYLAAMDAYFMSSDFEGTPVALLEAMAMELPAVVTDAGGIPEVIEHGRSGAVLPRGDVAGLLRELDKVLRQSRQERAVTGRAARERISERFGTERMMREIEQVYDHVLAR